MSKRLMDHGICQIKPHFCQHPKIFRVTWKKHLVLEKNNQKILCLTFVHLLNILLPALLLLRHNIAVGKAD